MVKSALILSLIDQDCIYNDYDAVLWLKFDISVMVQSEKSIRNEVH